MDRLAPADATGLGVFGVGEHHSAREPWRRPAHDPRAVACKRFIRLTSAAAVLSAADR